MHVKVSQRRRHSWANPNIWQRTYSSEHIGSAILVDTSFADRLWSASVLLLQQFSGLRPENAIRRKAELRLEVADCRTCFRSHDAVDGATLKPEVLQPLLHTFGAGNRTERP